MTTPALLVRSLGNIRRADLAPFMLITLGWASLAAIFTFSIAMVIWGRNGDNTLPF